MKLPAKILIWGMVLFAPAAAFAQRGGARSGGELRIGGGRGAGNRDGNRQGTRIVGVPIYYEPIPFGATFYPYTGFPYSTYTVPSTLPTYYLNPSASLNPAAVYVAAPPVATVAPAPAPAPTPAASSVQALATQVQALTAEVQRLRNQQTPPQVAAAPAEQIPLPRETTLVFRDSHRVEVQSYAIIDQTLRVLDKDKSARIALADLDLEATRRVNQENGVRFAMPSAQ